MKLLGVELTPVWVPIERRLQTFTVAMYVAMFMVLPFVTYFTAIGLFFTQYYWISIGYFTWCFYDNYFSKVPSHRVHFPCLFQDYRHKMVSWL